MLRCNLRGFSTTVPKGAVVSLAIGIFDGVHKGHAEILSRTAKDANEKGGIFGVLTFDPHPAVLFGGKGAAKLIFPLETRFKRLAEMGASFAICEPFTKEFASTPAEKFVDLLKDTIPTLASIHVGENFRFGAGRGGNVEILRSCGERLGITVNATPALEWDGEKISSTRIREAITRGEISDANAMLSKPYQIESKIISGKKLGREIGFPTLNLPWDIELTPRFGVYTVRAKWTTSGREISAYGVANFGIRPSVEEASTPLLETFLLNPPSEVPTAGDTLSVEFVEFLRPEQRFSSVEELRSQLVKDAESAREKFKI